jgi:hypothetical protein
MSRAVDSARSRLIARVNPVPKLTAQVRRSRPRPRGGTARLIAGHHVASRDAAAFVGRADITDAAASADTTRPPGKPTERPRVGNHGLAS